MRTVSASQRSQQLNFLSGGQSDSDGLQRQINFFGSPGSTTEASAGPSIDERAQLALSIFKPLQILRCLYANFSSDINVVRQIQQILGSEWAEQAKSGDMNRLCTPDQHLKLATLATRIGCPLNSDGRVEFTGAAATNHNDSSLVRDSTYFTNIR